MSELERQLTQDLQSALAALDLAKRENLLLRQKVEALIKRFFGTSSEKVDPKQLELLLQLAGALEEEKQEQKPEVEPAPATPVRSAKKERRPRIPQHLPIVEEVLDPEPVRQSPQDWRLIGQEVTEQLDFEPGRFFVRRLIRRKYVPLADKEAAPIVAALPPMLQEKSIVTPSLLAHVLVNKFCDHLPLYRQEEIFARQYGVDLPRQTLARWVELAASWLQPVYELLRTGVMAGGYIQVDETPVEYLSPGNGATKLGYLWVCSQPGGDVIFHWETGRGAACLENLIPIDFTGTIQCDGYSAYPAFIMKRNEVQIAGCMAHVRRKFHEALKHSRRQAGWIVRQIQLLYRVEAECREKKFGPAMRQAKRAAESVMIMARLEKALVRMKASRRFLPESSLGAALDYALGQWRNLQLFLKDGRLEIDNNLVENAIRPTALGKKNWLFVGEAEAGDRGAIIYSIVESCRRRGINPYEYLRDLLTRLPQMTNHQVKELLPATWPAPQPLRKAS
jgi:transposase